MAYILRLLKEQQVLKIEKEHLKGLKRNLKKVGAITSQVGCKDKKPKQVKNWIKVLEASFENVKVLEAFIPSFDCRWNFASAYLK